LAAPFIVTGTDGKGFNVTALQNGADDYLPKTGWRAWAGGGAGVGAAPTPRGQAASGSNDAGK